MGQGISHFAYMLGVGLQYYMNIDIEKEIGMKVERILGRGSFATVYYCIDRSVSRPFAVKVFHKKDFTKNRLNSFRKQAEILASIQHRNVVKFSSFKQTQSSLYLVMQYIPGGTLKNLMAERQEASKKFSDDEVSVILKSILEGIQYLHRFNIIHRDLKPENILIVDPGDLGSIKIVDFGLSAQIEAGSPTNVKSQCGTLLFMAPEILHQPSYSKAVDIWSCAVIMYILYTGNHPIFVQGMKSQTFKEQLRTCCFPKLPNPLADNFIRNLSKIEYTQRYSVNQALKHPWITRNQQDEIPLSVNESMHSFNTSHIIADALKFVCTVGQFFQHSCKVPQDYVARVRNIVEKSDENRARSPSYKKTRQRTNNTITKLKQIIIGMERDKNDEPNQNEYLQMDSPVLVKHQKLFLRLFDKQKVENPAETIVLEECQKPVQNEPSKEIQSPMSIPQQQPPSPGVASYESLSPMKNSSTMHYDVDLPLIKITYDKKKEERGGLRKMNSLREQHNGKYEQNFSYFRNVNKNSEEKNRQIIGSSKSKRIACKFQEFRLENPPKNLNKKPQTAQRGKISSKNKESAKPMTFGMRDSYF